jgi:hypothetical protein
MKTLARNTPVWFKRKPRNVDSTPNAYFCRNMGQLNGQNVCEIGKHGKEKWIVRDSEIMVHQEALNNAAAEYQSQIMDAKSKLQAKPFKKNIAAALGISVSTLRTRLKLIEIYLK